jgi:hypothetical protein
MLNFLRLKKGQIILFLENFFIKRANYANLAFLRANGNPGGKTIGIRST